ncbi:tobamovirus multiplication 1 [Quillaja saponaria]|nr:tobamovirus multiplication 1 [Quillaja saponaria]
MNFIVNAVRATVFGFHKQVILLHPKGVILMLLDLPWLLFFSTYTLLVLSWVEIYHQAKSLPTDKLRTAYVATNVAVYFIRVCIWVYIWIDNNSVAAVSFIAPLGFLLYGGRLFFMLINFPLKTKAKKEASQGIPWFIIWLDLSLQYVSHVFS